MDKEYKDQTMHDQIEKDQKEEKRKIANTEVYLHCRGHAAIALNKLHGGGLDTSAVIDRLSRSVDRILDNNTNEIQAMLISQAKSLEYMFFDALGKLHNSSIEHAEVIAKIAIRAQSGCRKTLLALMEIKHPRRITTFIKQQNNHAINQQVNNGVKSALEETQITHETANELRGGSTHETTKLDIGATITTSSKNTPPENMAILNRSKNS